MKRSTINAAFVAASNHFERHHRHLPPRARWDITDFGLGDFRQYGLTLVNLASQPEYCEKLMYAQLGQITPCHTHLRKKEDISCQVGELTLLIWPDHPVSCMPGELAKVEVNGEPIMVAAGLPMVLQPGSRITLRPGTWHAFYPTSDECIVAEVSTANDDLHDNVFARDDIGRFPGIEEDVPSVVRLVSEPSLSA